MPESPDTLRVRQQGMKKKKKKPIIPPRNGNGARPANAGLAAREAGKPQVKKQRFVPLMEEGMPIQEGPKPALAPRRKPPVPILQQYGFHGDVDEFSSRLSMASMAFKNSFGYLPTPGLTFDLARSNIPVEKFPDMLMAPKSKRQAQVWSQIPDVMGDPTKDRESAIKEIQAAIREDRWTEWISKPENEHTYFFVHNSPDPEDRALLSNAIMTAHEQVFKHQQEELMANMAYAQSGWFIQHTLTRQMFKSRNPALVPLKVVIGIPNSLVYAAPAVGLGLKGGFFDFRDLLDQSIAAMHGRSSGKRKTFPRTTETAKAVGKSYKQYYGKIYHDPGYILEDPSQAFMDGAALVTLGGGAIGRASALKGVGAMRAEENLSASQFTGGVTKDMKTLVEYEKRHAKISERQAKEEKMPDTHPWTTEHEKAYSRVKSGKMSWQQFSKIRGYTDKEIRNHQEYLDSVNEGMKLGIPKDELAAIDREIARGEYSPHFEIGRGRIASAIRRPLPEEYELTKGKQKATFLLSENTVVRAWQKFIKKQQQKKLDRIHAEAESGLVPVDSYSATRYRNAIDWWHDNFSIEAKFGRRVQREGYYNEIMDTLPAVRELERVAGRSIAASRAFKRMPDHLRRGLNLAEQKAIQVVATDAESIDKAFEAHRGFHNWAIEAKEGITREHKRHLALLDAAEKVLNNPKKNARFEQALKLTAEVIAEQERIKITEFGLDPFTAKSRVVRFGQILRGETAYGTDVEKMLQRELDIRLETLDKRLRGKQTTRSPKDIEADILAIEKEISKKEQATPMVRPPTPGGTRIPYESRKPIAEALRKAGIGHSDTKMVRHGDKVEVISPRGKLIATVHLSKTEGMAVTKTSTGKLRQGDLVRRGKGDFKRIAKIDNREHGFSKIHFEDGSTKRVPHNFIKNWERQNEKTEHRVVNEVEEAKKASVMRVADEAAKKDAEGSGYGYISKYAEDERLLALRKELEEAKASVKGVDKREIKKLQKEIEELKGHIETVRTPELLNPNAFYLPQVTKSRINVFRRNRGKSVSQTPYGIAPPRGLIPELEHMFLGKSMVQGDFRVDATSLALESYGKVARALTVLNHWDKMWKASTKNKTSDRDIPIRNVKNIPKELRNVMIRISEGTIGNRDAGLLPEDMRDLLKELYPVDSPEMRKLAESGEVRWIDPAIIGQIHRPSAHEALPGFMNFMDAVNSPFRFATLYARPAYALNFVSNVGMAVLAQGWSTGPNMWRSYNMGRLYGKVAADTIKILTGEGRSKAYVAPESALGMVGGKGARFWSIVTDENMRASALIYHLRKRNFDIKKLNNPHKLSAEDKRIVAVSAERANKDMVQFDNLLPIEKEWIRHIIFVYPWVSRSTVWSLRTMVERPIKTAVLSDLGQMVENTNEEDPILSKAPEWFKRTGYIPIHWDGDKPVVVNPTTLNTFASLAQNEAIMEDLFFHDVPFESFEDSFGPFAKLITHSATGKDEFGNDYPGPAFWEAAKEILLTLPQIRAAKQKKDKKLGPIDYTKSPNVGGRLAAELITREHKALKNVVFTPYFQNGLANWFSSWTLGGFSPKVLDPESSAARFWKGRPWQEQYTHNAYLQRKFLKMQAELLGRPVPKDAKDAVEFNIQLMRTTRQWQEDHGTPPTDNEKIHIAMDLMEKKEMISEWEVAVLKRELENVADKRDTNRIWQKVLRHSGAKAYNAFFRKVRMAASFNEATMTRDVNILKGHGLWNKEIPPKVSENEYREMGRRMVEFDEEDDKWNKRIKDADSEDKPVLEAQYREWLMDRKPLHEGFPSAANMATAREHPDNLNEIIRSTMLENWSKIGYNNRMLLRPKGTKGIDNPVSQRAMRGWASYERTKRDFRKSQGPGDRSVTQDQKDALAKMIDSYVDKDGNQPYKGFLQDYNFAKKRLANRLATYRQFRISPAKTRWNELFKQADQLGKTIDAGYPETQAKDYWKDYTDAYEQYWAERDPKWRKELNNFKKTRPTFLASLLSKGTV